MAYANLAKDDLLNIVLIGIANELPAHSNEYGHDGKYELHRLLNTLLSMELSADEKLGIMENEYSKASISFVKNDLLLFLFLENTIRFDKIMT